LGGWRAIARFSASSAPSPRATSDAHAAQRRDRRLAIAVLAVESALGDLAVDLDAFADGGLEPDELRDLERRRDLR
jgi:hypothetical protein